MPHAHRAVVQGQPSQGGWEAVGGWPVVLGVMVIRLFVLPALGWVLVHAAASLHLLPADPLVLFVILLQVRIFSRSLSHTHENTRTPIVHASLVALHDS